MPILRTRLSQFSLVGGRRRNHTDAIACRQPSRRPFGAGRAHLYLLAEHIAARGQEHRFCQFVMREVQLAFVAEESAGTPAALMRAIMLVNRNLWQGCQDIPLSKRLPIGLVAAAIDGDDLYVCQIAAGQVFVTRGTQVASWPDFDHWRAVHSGETVPTVPLGQDPELVPTVMHCNLQPGDRLVLAASNLACLIDRDALVNVTTRPGETPGSSLSRLAEDFGILDTCGMTIDVAGRSGSGLAAAHLAFTPVPPERVVTRTTTIGPMALFGHFARRAHEPAPAASSSSAPIAVGATAPDHDSETRVEAHLPETTSLVEETLPDNIVRIYHTLPVALSTVPAPALQIDDGASLMAEAAVERRAPRPALLRTRRARWLDALAVSMVVATDALRRPGKHGPLPAGRRRGARSRPADAPAEVLYRGSGRLSPAGIQGFATPLLAAGWLRWPTSGLNSVLAVAMVGLAAVLATLALQAFLRAPKPTVAQERAGQAPVAIAHVEERPMLVVATVSERDTMPPVDAPMSSDALAADSGQYGTATSTQLAASPDTVERRTDVRPVQAMPGLAARSQLAPGVVLADLSTSGTPPTSPKQLIVGHGKLYLLDPYTSTLYLIDSTDKKQSTLLARGWSIAKEKVLDLQGITWRGDTLVVMDKNRAYTLDGPGDTWRVTPLAGAGLGAGVHQVASYDGGLYVLDSAKGQVLKYAQGAYQKPPQPWLKVIDKGDLTGAVDLAIDGQIYALTASGQLVTLLRGEVERRQSITTTPPLQSPAALVSPSNSQYLYIADTTGRVVKLTKDGAVVAQYQAADSGADLAQLSSFWVNEASNTMFAVAGNRVVRVAMPEVGRTNLS